MHVLIDGVLDDTETDIDDDRPEEVYVDGIPIILAAAAAGVRNPIWIT